MMSGPAGVGGGLLGWVCADGADPQVLDHPAPSCLIQVSCMRVRMRGCSSASSAASFCSDGFRIKTTDEVLGEELR